MLLANAPPDALFSQPHPPSRGVHLGVLSVLAVALALRGRRSRERRDVGGEGDLVASPDAASFCSAVYMRLPLRVLSRAWGRISRTRIPSWARAWIFRIYGRMFGCRMAEVEKPLREYKSLGEFFTRRLKPGSRPIDKNCDMVSPVDGRVLTFGEVTSDIVEQVKGVRYSMSYFLGEPIGEILESGRRLYQIVIYLAPGDYHCFHSPTDWTIDERTHFHGKMLSVSKIAAKYIPGLFAINERVVLKGRWTGGIMYYSPVAATNVGNIVLNCDPELRTNLGGKRDKMIKKIYSEGEGALEGGVGVGKGEEMGAFRMGSTVVMVFEGGEDFRFFCEKGGKVRMGEMLGSGERLETEE